MRLPFRLSLLAITTSLCACSTVQSPSIMPPDTTQEAFRLEASGEQVFRCRIDAHGWFWKFEAPNAYLFDPETNQAVAKHGYNFTFVHNDGSKLKTKIISTEPRQGNNLPEALFAVNDSTYFGKFAQVKYVQRLNTKGGVPAIKCSKEKNGQLARVPFSAEFVFFK